LALVVSAPALAQSDVDPARLAIAQQVVEQVVPSSQREAMIESIVRPTMANIESAFGQSPELKTLFDNDPAMRGLFLKFITAEQERAIVVTKQSLPLLFEAMTRAYARHFSVEQLNDIKSFFETPSGRAYVAQSLTMMSDPDVQQAQRTMMTRSLEGMQARIQAFVAEMRRTKGGKK
jgi:hypothetical protein